MFSSYKNAIFHPYYLLCEVCMALQQMCVNTNIKKIHRGCNIVVMCDTKCLPAKNAKRRSLTGYGFAASL